MRLIVVLALLVLPRIVCAQQAQSPPATPPPPDQPMPQFEEQVEVVGVTPIHGVGLPALKVPSNVQVFTASQISTATLDLPSLLASRAASLHVVEAQGGAFQPDVVFRGFVGSPLLGASEGLAVYQDGVRMNEAFGDTVNWDGLPPGAIASINLMPGSNPLFGLNALGGALSLRTKDGFAFPGARASITTGSFGRHDVQGEIGGHGSSVGYFVAGSFSDESGWRDFSPSTIRRVFGDLAWRGTATALNVSVTAASNDMTGNGAVPVRLLEEDRAAVFTHPDRTDNDLGLVTVRGQRRGAAMLFDAVAYYRHGRIGTFNGDAGDDDDDDDEEEDESEHDSFVAVNNLSRTRGRAAGVTAQATRTATVLGRENHFILGGGLDAAASRFDFAAELAHLTPERGTIGAGLFDEDAFTDLDSRTITGSAFISNTWSLTTRVSVMGSARLNWTSVRLRDRIGTALDGDHRFRRVNPASGLTVQVARDLNVYGSYAQSSRVPTPVELTCADPDDPCRLPNAFVSDPPLNQIVAGTWEAGVRAAPGRARWSVAGFTTAATDDIVFVSSGTLRGEGHFENVSRTRRSGFEASLDHPIRDRVTVAAAYTVQRATFGTHLRIASRFHPLSDDAEIRVASGSRIPGVPTHTGKLSVEAAASAGLWIAVAVRAQSAQYLRGDEANLLPPVAGFTVVNAQAGQRITSRVAAVGHLQNIFDTRYSTFGLLGDAELLGEEFDDERRFYSPGAPRGGWIGLEVRF